MAQYQMCSQCVMDTTDLDIQFDKRGVCNYCHSYHNFMEGKPHENIYRREVLDNAIDKMKSAGNKYDCILGISGGVDSSYLCHLLKEWGINPLLVHFDNTWNSDLAEENMRRLVEGTGFELQRYTVDWEEFRELQRAYFKASVIDVEVLTDHGAIAVLYQKAQEYGIKTVIVGQNYATEFAIPRRWNYTKWDLVNIKAICDQFSSVPIKSFPVYGILSVRDKFNYLEPLQYIDFNQKKAKQELADTYGWRPYPYKHYESLFTLFYQSYYLPVKFGIDKRKMHLSNLIWSGQMTREEALESLHQPLHSGQEFQDLKAYVLNKLKFSDAEWREIMSTPPVPHTAFPNSLRLINTTMQIKNSMKQ